MLCRYYLDIRICMYLFCRDNPFNSDLTSTFVRNKKSVRTQIRETSNLLDFFNLYMCKWTLQEAQICNKNGRGGEWACFLTNNSSNQTSS